MKRTLVVALLLTNMAFARDDFKSVVKAVESTYGIHSRHIPMMGLMLKFSPEREARGVKLAIFEDSPARGDLADLQQVIGRNLGPEWTPFIRVWSRRDDESVVIYAKPEGARMRLMVASFDHEDSVIISVDATEESLRHWINDPAGMADRTAHEDSGDEK